MKKGASPSICCHIWCHIPICADNLVFLRLSVNMEFQEVTSSLRLQSHRLPQAVSRSQFTPPPSLSRTLFPLGKWLYF